MTHQEFEDLTGISTSPEDYARIELIYMSASQRYDKQMFCEALKNTDKNAENLMYDLAKTITDQEQAMHRTQEQSRKEWEEQGVKDRLTAHTLLKAAERFYNLGNEDDGWECEEMAHNLIGECEAIKLKIAEGIELTKEDKEYIDNHLK